MKATVTNTTRVDREEGRKAHWWSAPPIREIPRYIVTTAIEFSEEERAILTERHLWATPVFNMTVHMDALAYRGGVMPAEDVNVVVTVQMMVEGKANRAFENAVEALNYEQKMKKEYLPGIKRLIDASERLGGKSETLEF